jgi:hypothetical protein
MWQKAFLKRCLREKAFIDLSFIDFLVLRTVLATASSVSLEKRLGKAEPSRSLLHSQAVYNMERDTSIKRMFLVSASGVF